MDQQLDFLDRVWGDATGFVQLVQKRQDDQGNRTGDPTDGKFFRWPQERERIGRHIMLRTEEDLYFSVPLYSKAQRLQSDVKLISAVYVDDDGVTGEYRLKPSVIVYSSPGHKHVYWALDAPADPTRALRIGAEISAAHKHDNEAHADMADHKFCGTDPGGWDASQILRVPGTLNTKKEYGPEPHRIEVEDTGMVYSIEELEAAYPHTQIEYVSMTNLEEIPAGLPELEPLLTRLGGRVDLIDLFTNEPTGRGNSSGWDERLYALENELFRLGWSAPEVYVVALHSACNKFRRGVRNGDGTFTPRPNPDGDLWRDVAKAEQVHGTRGGTWIAPDYNRDSAMPDDPENPWVTPEGRPKPPGFTMELLTDEELALVEEHKTFIDTYVSWATSKTDAAYVYHIASAFTILSLVFGEFGHASPKFGKLRLNLWFLVMGKTTRARKSTSRGLMLKVIKGIQTAMYQYDMGSDFTAEGLTSSLLDKPRQSSLIHRDEVQGMFKEINTKNYMSGLSDILTALYDGEVNGKVRTGSGMQEGAEVNFVLFLMGIVSKITDILTLEDFQSGFLSRFIHVIGEAPARTKESEWLDQAPLNEVMTGDPVYIAMIKDLMLTRTKWQKIAEDRHTVSIRFEDDAWRRWNEANWDLQESVQQHERAEILEAALDRMGKSAIKASALIAMSEGRNKVNLTDVLVALKYMNGWAVDMVRSSELVSESFWKKDMNSLVDLALRKGGTIKWEEAYSKMDKKPHEFAQLVEGAVLSGRLTVQVDAASKSKWLEAKL